MKQLLILLVVAVTSCTNQRSEENKTENDHEKAVATIPLNNGAKWKADEATRRNVAAMVQVINDTTYADVAKRKQLHMGMQTKIDTLVKQCRMKGPEHDALHVWLEKVLEDMKELNKDDHEFSKTHAALKKDVESFYQYFE